MTMTRLYAVPIPYTARSEREMQALKHERTSLRATLNEETRRGRAGKPAAREAKARLQKVEREIALAEDAARNLQRVGTKRTRPAVPRQARAKPQYMPIAAQGQMFAAQRSAFAGNGAQDFASRWAQLFNMVRPGEPAFLNS